MSQAPKYPNTQIPKDKNFISLNTKQTLYKSQSKILMEIFPNLEMLYILIHSSPNIPASKNSDTEIPEHENVISPDSKLSVNPNNKYSDRKYFKDGDVRTYDKSQA